MQAQYDGAVAAIDVLIERLHQPVPRGEPLPPSPPPPLTSNLTQERFEAMVQQAKEYIAAGDVIQVVLSQCFQPRCATTPLTSTGPCAASTRRPTCFIWTRAI